MVALLPPRIPGNSRFKCTLNLFVHCFQAVKSAFFLMLQRFNGE